MHEFPNESFSNLCRLCGEVDRVCLNLFDNLAQGGEILSRIEKFVRISISQDDGLPTNICSECNKKLSEYFLFYQNCHDTQQRLQEFISIESAIHKTSPSKQPAMDENDVITEVFVYENSEGSNLDGSFPEEENQNYETVHAEEDVSQGQEQQGEEEVCFPKQSLPSTNKNTEEELEEHPTLPFRDTLSTPLSHLREHLYETLSSSVNLPQVAFREQSSINVSSIFDESERSCSSFRKEMDVLLCGETVCQTESQLSCASESQSLASPSFSLQGEEFSLDQGGAININEFPLEVEQESLPITSDVTKQTGCDYAPISAEREVSSNKLDFSYGRELESSQIQETTKDVTTPVQLDGLVVNEALDAILKNANSNHDLNELGNISSLHESSMLHYAATQIPSDTNAILTVNATVIGASGDIKFQRNQNGVKILFPPTTAERTVGFDDLIRLFSLNEVREMFCADNKQEGIIQQLVQQGLGAGKVSTSGRASVLSQSSSIDLPNSLLSPLSSVCDSWSWEISQLLSGDENSNQGVDGGNRSELNTPNVTLPPKHQRDLSVLKDNNPFIPLDQSLSGPLDDSTHIPNASQVHGTEFASPSVTRLSCIPQRVLSPLQVQIPEDNDTPIRFSRTLNSSNTYFDELSLGISPVLDLDPNVATVRLSCPPTETSVVPACEKGLNALPTSQSLEVDGESNHVFSENCDDSLAKALNCDIKEVSVDIIIDDGKRNWLKLVPNPTDEFIKTVSYNCFKCILCSKSFRFKFQVQRHLRTNHSKDKPFICAICGATFSIKYYLTRHMKLHSAESKLHCKFCSKEFNRKYQLVEHELSHKGPPTLKCSDCGKRFNSKNAFYLHKSFCTANLQSYVCDICGKTYPGKTALNHHRVRHETVKKFSCSKCHSAFHTRWQLVKHDKRHNLTGHHICRVCSLAFTSTTNLKKHESKCPALFANGIIKQ